MQTSFEQFIEIEVPKDGTIVSRTDLKGIITYANETFAQICGYTQDELIGNSHNIIRHPDMPNSIYKDLWDSLKNGKTWEGYIKNRAKSGRFYWVFSVISPVIKNGILVEYKAIRSYVSKEKQITMQKIYDDMRLNRGDSVRITEYVSSQTYKNLEKYLEKNNLTLNSILEEFLDNSSVF